jgi:alkylated DNA repair dioxygenase AlkB
LKNEETKTSLKTFRQIVQKDGCVRYFSGVFDPSLECFEKILSSVTWNAEVVRVFGTWRTLRRSTAWYGSSNYGYSGQVKREQPWLPILFEIKSAVEELSKQTYQGVLLNLYPDGGCGMGWHADNEKDLMHDSPISSVSFGATRRFDLRHKDGETVNLDLEDGSVLIMSGKLQRFWRHQVPVQKRIHEPRINLTFRVMKQ